MKVTCPLFGQSDDIRNLFVVDGDGFVPAGWQNSTLTIMASSMRSPKYIAGQMRTGEI